MYEFSLTMIALAILGYARFLESGPICDHKLIYSHETAICRQTDDFTVFDENRAPKKVEGMYQAVIGDEVIFVVQISPHLQEYRHYHADTGEDEYITSFYTPPRDHAGE